MTGYSLEDVLGKNCRFLQGEKTDKETVKKVSEAVSHQKPIKTRIVNYKKDGTSFWNEFEIKPIFGSDNKVLSFMALEQEVLEAM